MIRKKIALLLSLAMAVTSVPAMVTGTMEAKTVNAQESIYQGMEQRLLRYWHLIHQRQMGMTA